MQDAVDWAMFAADRCGEGDGFLLAFKVAKVGRLTVQQTLQRIQTSLRAHGVDHLGALRLQRLGDVPGDRLLVGHAEDEEGFAAKAEERHDVISGGLVDEGERETQRQDGLAIATDRAREKVKLLQRLHMLHFDNNRVAGLYHPLELSFFDTAEYRRLAIGGTAFGLQLAGQVNRAGLKDRLAQEDPGGDGVPRIMAGIERLIGPEGTGANSPIGPDLFDFIDEKERGAVRDGGEDFRQHACKLPPELLTSDMKTP